MKDVGADFTLVDLIRILKTDLPKSILIALIFGAVWAVGNFFFVPPYFVSSASIISPAKESLALGNSAAQFLLQNRGMNSELLQYQKILETENVRKKVAEKLSLDPSRLVKKLTTRIDGPALEMTVEGPTAEESQNRLREFLNALENLLQESSSAKAKTNETFVKDRLSEAEQQLSQLEKGVGHLKFNESQRETQIQTKIVLLLREQYELARIETKKQQQMFQVIEPPTLPSKQAGPSALQNAVMAAILAFISSSAVFLIFRTYLQEAARIYRPTTLPPKQQRPLEC